MPNTNSGMRNFTIIWIGQVLSLVGTAMTGFALTIWAFQLTGKATALALVGFFNFTPQIIFSPIAGALVDRWNRKLVMALSDSASALATLTVFILFSSGHLQIWHLYVTGAFSGFFQSFQWPAYSAAISTMIPKKQFARASGMMSIAEWGSGVLAPVLASAMIAWSGVGSVMLVDLTTFGIALAALLAVAIPQPVVTSEGLASRGSLWTESAYGFRYILRKRPLLGLQLVFFGGNLMGTIGGTLIAPMILSRTANNATSLGVVESVSSACGILGSLIVTATGGPRRKVWGVLGGWVICGLGNIIFGLRGGMPIWILGILVGIPFGPIINASNQAIWQSKVAPDIQGKVFAVRRMIAQISVPISMLVAGPLADNLAEPLMRNSSSGLARSLGGLFGTGPGAGMGALISASGVLILIVSLLGVTSANVRNAETLLPDIVQENEEIEQAEPSLAG